MKNSVIKKGKKGVQKAVFGRAALVILLLALQVGAVLFFSLRFEKYLAEFYGAITAMSFIMSLYVIGTHSNPTIKLSWTALIIITPIFGTFLYIFTQAEIGHRLLNRRLSKIISDTAHYTPQDDSVSAEAKKCDKSLANMSHYLYTNGGFPIYKNSRAEYFPVGENKWEAMLSELKKAQKYIFLEYFIVEEGEMWNSVLEILKEKASQGVDVRMLYDGTCSISLLPPGYPKKLRRLGIKCKIFSPLRPFVSTHYNNRDHRKILVIDGKTAFTGGVNLADEYVNRKNRFGHWKDSSVMIKGDAVRSFVLMFLQMWNLSEKECEYDKFLAFASESNEKSDGYVIPYADSPLDDERVGEGVYMDIINTANEYVYIMTPYLILDAELSTALRNAAKRGVDVRIIIPSVPDHKVAYSIAQTYCRELVPQGVRIYKYTPGFIHSKVFVSDSAKAVVGTINLDYRSLYLHFECGAYFYGSSIIGDIEKDFAETFEKCEEIKASDVKRGGFFSGLKTGLLRAIAPLM